MDRGRATCRCGTAIGGTATGGMAIRGTATGGTLNRATYTRGTCTSGIPTTATLVPSFNPQSTCPSISKLQVVEAPHPSTYSPNPNATT